MNKNTVIKRIEYVDTARGVLIILVVFGHTLLFSGGAVTPPYSYIMKAIYSFHMTAFFLISGFLFNKEKWCNSSLASFCKNRALRLIVPYFFFETIGATIHTLFSWESRESILTIIKNILFQNVYIGADWYLPTLFCGEVLLFLCCKYLPKNVNIAIAIVGFLAVASAQGHINSQMLCIVTRTVLCASILLIGYYAQSCFLSVKPCWCVLGAFVVWIVSSQLNRLPFPHAAILGNVTLFLLSGFCGTYFVLAISEKAPVKFLKYLGNNTLPIMGIHQNIEYLIVFFWGTSTSAVFILLSFWIMFLPELFVVPLLNRICPFLIGKKKVDCKIKLDT